jgi:hypothetical protein
MIIPLMKKKPLTKIQHPFLIKKKKTQRKQKEIPQHSKSVYDK